MQRLSFMVYKWVYWHRVHLAVMRMKWNSYTNQFPSFWGTRYPLSTITVTPTLICFLITISVSQLIGPGRGTSKTPTSFPSHGLFSPLQMQSPFSCSPVIERNVHDPWKAAEERVCLRSPTASKFSNIGKGHKGFPKRLKQLCRKRCLMGTDGYGTLKM